MSNVQIIKWKKGLSHQDWLTLRRTEIQGIGKPHTRLSASDIGTLTGASKYKSKRRLFLSMAGIYSKDYVTPLMTQGNVMEKVVGEYYEGYDPESVEESLRNTTNGTKLRTVEKAQFFVINKTCDHLSASLDFIHVGEAYSPWTGEKYGKLSPVEAKYIQEQAYRGWGTDIPEMYLQQMMIQLHCTEESVGVFAPLLTSGGFKPIEVHYDPELAEHLVKLAGEFCRDVTKVKILLIEKELAESDSEKEAIQMQVEKLIPYDDVVKDSWELGNEIHTSYTSDAKQVEEFTEEDILMENYLQILQDEKDLDERKNFTKANLIRLAEGFEGIESPTTKAIIRGKNSEKNQYFSVKRKTNNNKKK